MRRDQSRGIGWGRFGWSWVLCRLGGGVIRDIVAAIGEQSGVGPRKS